MNCSSLTSIIIPDNITSIGWSAFYGTGLTNLDIPNCVTTIGSYAFSACSNLESIELPEELTSIESRTFKDCASLTSINIPNKVSTIGEEAFAGCYNLDSIISSIEEPFAIRSGVFPNSIYKSATLYVPFDKIDTYKSTGGWQAFYKIQAFDVAGSTVTLFVTDESGVDITDMVSITWYDSTGKVIGEGKSLSGIGDDLELYYSVTFDEELGRVYREVIFRKVLSGDGVQRCQLERIVELSLHGRVTNLGSEMAKATVSLTQWLNGKYKYTVSTQTDANGEFTIAGYNDSTELIVSYPGFVDSRIERRSLGGHGEFGNIELQPVTGKVIDLALSYQEAARAGEEPVVIDWYSDMRNIGYAVSNLTKETEITDFSVQQGNIVLPFGTDVGDRLQVTLRSLNGKFADVTAEATVNANDTVHIDMRLTAFGGVEAVCGSKADDKLVAMLYDSKGNLTSQTTFSSTRVTFTDLPEGQYSLVTMGYSSAVGIIGSMQDLDLIGLSEGSDYVMTSVNVENGIIGSVAVGDIPELDASKFEMTSLNTSYLPNKTEMVVGNGFVTLTARVDFKTQYANEVSNVRLMVDIPEGCEFIANSVVTGTKPLPHTIKGKELTITLSPEDIDSRIRFCVTPQKSGTYVTSARATFDYRGEKTLNVGSSTFIVTSGSISVPSISGDSIIYVKGMAAPHSEIDIFDNGHMIGTTTSLGDGTWNAMVELYKPYNLSSHVIDAKFTNFYGYTETTGSQVCSYEKATIEAKSVTMYFNSGLDKLTFDYKTGQTSQNYYNFRASDFTFVADLTANDTITVKGVTFYVFTISNQVTTLRGIYDNNIGRWVAYYRSDSWDSPINVSVSVEAIRNEPQADRNYITDGLSMAQQAIESANAEAAEISAILSENDVAIDNEAMYAELLVLLATPDYDDDKVRTLMQRIINNIPPSGTQEMDEEAFEQLDANFNSLQKAFEEQLLFEQTIGMDSLLNGFVLNTNNLDSTMPEAPYSGRFTTEGSTYSYSVEEIASVDESQLLDNGFMVMPMTDGSKIYCLVSENKSVFIDIANKRKYTYELTSEVSSSQVPRRAPAILNTECLSAVQSWFRTFGQGGSDADAVTQSLTAAQAIISSLGCVYQTSMSFVLNWLESCRKARIDALDDLISRENKRLAVYRDWFSKQQVVPADRVAHMRDIERNISSLNQQKTRVEGIYGRIMGRIKELPSALTPTSRIGKAAKLLGKIGGGLGVFSDIYELYMDMEDAADELSRWLGLWAMYNRLLPCKGDEAALICIHDEMANDTRDLLGAISTLGNSRLSKIVIDVNALKTFAVPEAELALFVASVWTGLFTDLYKTVRFTHGEFALKEGKHRNDLKKLKCEPDDGKEDYTPPTPPPPPTKDVIPQIDPSGFVYEAVPTNRIEGVTATIYEQAHSTTPWDAADFSQVNPQITDKTGLYQWDVPQGMWQVRFEKSGYETTQTEWLPVPPPQLEINIPMSQVVAPQVVKARGTESGITIDFSKYMKPETVERSGRVSAIVNGSNARGDVEMLNAEENPCNNKVYASRVKFVPTAAFKTSDEVVITVKKEVESYADKQMAEDFVAKVKIESEIDGIVCDSLIAVDYHGEHVLEISGTPAAAVKGRTLSITTTSAMIATADRQNVTFDDEGKASFTVNGNLPGSASLHLQIDGTDTEKYVEVNVVLHETVVRAPKASKRSGSTIEAGYLLWLTSSTPGATIYYTLDGSCPCDVTTRQKFTEPIVLPAGNVTIKAIAIRHGMEDSDVATFSYVVEGSNVGIEKTKEDLQVDAKLVNGLLTVNGVKGCIVCVYDLAGRELANSRQSQDSFSLILPQAESCIVCVTTATGQTVVRKVIRK